MNCREFERRLDAGAPLDADAAGHMESCEACRELEEMVRASLSEAPPSGDTPAGLAMPGTLTRDVMARTTGPACEAAGDRLIDFVDNALGRFDRELVLSHLEGCAVCEATVGALGWMAAELSSMAAIDPGEKFTAAVLRATQPGLAGRLATQAAARAPEPREPWWLAIWQRPRFTWEAAYTGALVIWLLFGAGFAPLREVPSRALELARTNNVQPASVGREVWQATGGALIDRTRSTAPVLDRLKGVGEASSSLAGHGAAALGSVIQGDLSGSAVRLKDMGDDLKRIYDELTRRQTQPAKNPKEA